MSASNKIILNWDEALKAGPMVAGGKGRNLGRLDRYGFPVPPGCVLSTQAYLIFIEHNGLGKMIKEFALGITVANVTDPKIEQQLARFRDKIIGGALPPDSEAQIELELVNQGLSGQPVAVRSSASLEDSGTTSFAGIQDSYLNVTGSENIFEAVKKCYASLWTTRAVSYRRKMNIPDDELLPAVVIMTMVQAQAAGIGFTCDPRTGRQDVIIINANFGLGESVVGGLVEPDEYRLDALGFIPRLLNKNLGKKDGRTITQAKGGTAFIKGDSTPGLGDQQALSNENITKLALLLVRVFEALGAGELNQDVEWAFDGRDFFLLQARPVTCFPRYTYAELQGQPDYWSNANVKDALPMVQCTLNRRLVTNLFTSILTAPFKVAGYPVLPGLIYNKFYNGRIYVNASLMQWEFYDALGITPKETNEAAGGRQPELYVEEKETNKKTNRARNWRKLKLGLAILRAHKKALRDFESVRVYARSWRQTDLTRLTDQELLTAVIDITARTKTYAPTLGMMNSSLGLSFQMLTATLEKSFPGEGNAMANAIMLGKGNITSAEQGYRLLKMAEKAHLDLDAKNYLTAVDYNPLEWETVLPENSPFKSSFRIFLDEFGHRAVYEGDLNNPRWREDPSYLLDLVRTLMDGADYGNFKRNQLEKNKASQQRINRATPYLARLMVNWWAKQAIRSAEMRETSKSELVRLAEPFRAVAMEIGRRLVERGVLVNREDVFHCSWPDLAAILSGHWDGRGLATLVNERRDRENILRKIPAPDLIVNESPSPHETTHTSQASPANNVMTGVGVAAGKSAGPARLINHPDEGNRLNLGEVLVAPSTDPGWTPLFLKASALVMETGGSLSHGAIVAREFGLPAVVNVPGAMVLIKDGQTVTVDGNEGKVYL
ncbi:MAG: hypothetical protein VR67_07030 [Peptococcaceae bacterium BRH_c8a]|nr:MAG: hypothetical protein VR67_07030 [Peptococcaceae bacterium BRH_c8a]